AELAARLARWGPMAGALWLVALLTWALARRAAGDRPLSSVAVTVLAVLYTGALPAFLLVIRHGTEPVRSWPGTWLVFFPLVVTWVCDTAAMFGGRAIGGPKLAPSVSPGKTRSGSVAGVVGGILVAVIFRFAVFPSLGLAAHGLHLILMAAVLSVVGQVGDLAESLFKREASVKDSSTLIPGHGGVLDRFDSLYFVIPVAAVMYRLFGLI
ncbi:MAG: phosphatidate cytidylyltransferase, partial [Gemmatimonadales bacterium]|nr:phosphatidate cytidylyltransferase [Gemmatimonadales bacterium]